MADKKISELTNITGANLADADEFVVVDTSANETKAITYGELKKFTGDVTVSGAITATGGDLDLATLDLSAIDTSIADTAVDVFVYDTSKDSDGGAWRKRTQHTSWYNETLNTATRGSRREFPAVAVIVAEADTVTIYDGDDPALPMWMVFNGGNYRFAYTSAMSCVSALNGVICDGNNGAGFLGIADFLSDLWKVNNGGGGNIVGTVNSLSRRNDTLTAYDSQSASGVGVIVNKAVNDVAMTVLPDAPIDPDTGLPVPTIAVATAGGVSVIKDDGNVWDITFSGGWGSNITQIQAANENIYFQNHIYYWLKIPIKDVDQDRVIVGYPFGATAPFVQMQPNGTTFSAAAGVAFENSGIELAYSQGSTRTGFVAMSQDADMRFDVTSKFNTGWMNGDIKGAFLADTDDTDLVGSGELVTNGTFDTDTSGWTATGATPATLTQSSGEMTVTGQTATTTHGAQQSFSTVAGKTYVATVDLISASTTNRYFYIGSSSGIPNNLGTRANTAFVVGKNEITFVATGTTTWISLYVYNIGDTITVDNISVKLADADRSVNKNGLIVNGTVARSAVATGAELVAYSGFSASNYLEQPYNSDLDFGTGDFCVMGWFKTNDNSTSTKQILERTDRHLGFTGGGQIAIEIDGTTTAGAFECGISDDNFSTVDTVRTSAVYDNNVWHHFTVVKSSGTLRAYIDGSLAASTTITNAVGSLNNANAKLAVGARVGGASPFNVSGSGLALLRISATAPTASQIKKIYEDEKVLFQENAACTLYGASDAVTALAHDPDTGLLHVGTSAGRSVFQGLRRVSNTTTAVGTAISAANGLVAEE